MPGSTTNFNFPYPLDTDPLADGAQEIQNLADDLDTTLVDLKGGTTDQYLAKNSNTDMDYKWVTFPAVGIPDYWTMRDSDATAALSVNLFESAADTFTCELNKTYYFKGQVIVTRAGASATFDLDLNFDDPTKADVTWNYNSWKGDSLFRSGTNITTDSETVIAATANNFEYTVNFEGIIRTDATGSVMTITPKVTGSAGTVQPQSDSWMKIAKLADSRTAVTATTGGWA